MGKYAEMMLDGTCCSSCGEFLGSSSGYAILCSACSKASERQYINKSQVTKFTNQFIGHLSKLGFLDIELERHFIKDFGKMLSNFYIDEKGLVRHDGMEKTILHNTRQKKR